MDIILNSSSGHSIGKIKAVIMMNTPNGLVRKVNENTVYIGSNQKATDNEKFDSYSMPIWYLRECDYENIHFFDNKSPDTLSHVDLAMMTIISAGDENDAYNMIQELSEFFTRKAILDERESKKKGEQRTPAFDGFSDLNVIPSLIAINKLTQPL